MTGAVFDQQQVPRPGTIFANNDEGQTRFWAPETPASKWGWVDRYNLPENQR